LAKVMAPFTPFVAEVMYRNLSRGAAGTPALSVHLEVYPEVDKSLEDPVLEAAVARMTQVMLMGRNAREKMGVKAKIPLNWMRVIHRDGAVLDALKPLEAYMVDELNVREVRYETDEDKFIEITTKANFPRLGPRLGKRMKAVAGAIQTLDLPQIVALEAGDSIEVAGESITLDDVVIRRAPREESATLVASQVVSIELDATVTEGQLQEGLAREIIRRIQIARKNADLRLDDRIVLTVGCGSPELKAAADAFAETIAEGTLSAEFTAVDGAGAGGGYSEGGRYSETAEIDGMAVAVSFTVVPRG